jgi:hypothetical protein
VHVTVALTRAIKEAGSVPTGKKRTAAEQAPLVTAYENDWRGCLPLSEAELSAAEGELGVTFPDALRALFLTCNGGKPARTYFENEQIMVEIGYLLPIRPPKAAKRRSYEEIFAALRLKSGLPSALLPFAYDNGNAGVFCVDAASGAVVYWVHDEPEDPTKAVADSLGEFLSKLTVPPY